MTGWNIDPDRVVGLLTRAGERRLRLDDAIQQRDVDDIIDGVFWPGQAGAVVAPLVDALVDLSALQGKQLAGVALLADTCLSGLTNTTLAYQAGMQEMAVQQQREMLRNADVLDGPPPPGAVPPHRIPVGP
ncbi:DUF6507 family protein [Pseudactinotalea suaedae]|jgi:hypothetical protein|uniref:DUF6507 family protein n=1 Tax=Pseudactinotalea suaedae TaxID=1524924 RepID=UPI0012E287C3|nr:DUF6507 family protein [Pseudactinotalea suaedae]